MHCSTIASDVAELEVHLAAFTSDAATVVLEQPFLMVYHAAVMPGTLHSRVHELLEYSHPHQVPEDVHQPHCVRP